MAATGPRLVSPQDHDISGLPGLLQPRGGTTAIDCSTELIEQIRVEAVDGFLRLPHGGLEIAGILFGTKEGGVVRLSASRPIQCEHARGPSLILSGRDEQGVEALLDNNNSVPRLH